MQSAFRHEHFLEPAGRRDIRFELDTYLRRTGQLYLPCEIQHLIVHFLILIRYHMEGVRDREQPCAIHDDIIAETEAHLRQLKPCILTELMYPQV